MRNFIFTILIVLIIISCERKDENFETYDYAKFQTSATRLVAVKLNNQLLYKLNYDSSGRMDQLDIYYSDTIYNSVIYKYNSNNQIVEKRNGYTIETYFYEDTKLLSISILNPSNPEWCRRIDYNYEEGRITDARVYFNKNISSYLKFEYDSRGNTISRKELSTDGKFLISEFKCTYGQARNPFPLNDFYPNDMIMNNNVIYSYYYAAIMSSFPPEYNSEFTFDDHGLVLEEKRIYKNYGRESQVYKYEYQKQ